MVKVLNETLLVLYKKSKKYTATSISLFQELDKVTVPKKLKTFTLYGSMFPVLQHHRFCLFLMDEVFHTGKFILYGVSVFLCSSPL